MTESCASPYCPTAGVVVPPVVGETCMINVWDGGGWTNTGERQGTCRSGGPSKQRSNAPISTRCPSRPTPRWSVGNDVAGSAARYAGLLVVIALVGVLPGAFSCKG